MTPHRKQFRIVALLGRERVEGAWTLERDDVEDELRAIQDAQATSNAIRLDWLAVASGRDVTAAFIEERSAPRPATIWSPDVAPRSSESRDRGRA